MHSALDIFRALGDPTRLRIVHLLRAMELAVGEIAQVVGQSQPRVSRHVRILAEAGLVERRKEGNWVFLRLARGQGIAPFLTLFDRLEPSQSEVLWQAADLARLSAVRAERARAAEAYFADHANEWDAIRSLHVPEAQVEAAMTALLAREPIGHMLDIGTGTGRMIELFGCDARQVTALDRSPDMLRLARAKLPQDAGDKYALLLGDFLSLPMESGSIDTVLCHQVLHYAQAPESVIAEAARVTARNGRVLIADFAPHQREELRMRDQHARLGFADAQIEGWFADAGLVLEQVESLPGQELTVQLWLGRRKGADVLPLERRISA
ncbi:MULTISPECIES: ArsR/SmtB family transcription factor [Sphingomonadaceae]|jgi:ubiquinone/menaquinone biosynthesis C-methylase UbiE|uniref:Metalloregulator ArsR/SmtB family transcription factor n=1 Tax=Sphingobium soli TaxID=1591116 RepID=A0ABS8GYZ3_9SPHN|nr:MULTISPECIES: metalloregulator ArsR/SmtB family transcription factor [Sphingomonadaceae]EAT06821.1 predicted transcriptional regulator [Sphingomonas sp. SKA58]MAP45797.1 ArsR family transcriptional regulator [Sphingobium sp.]MAX15276.1 ArsR family transcriptional regulator [Sphingobium sp.]MBA38039.1 ArsR family transcriptional regulator [Sphingobium sp.]MBS48119.1 ArsR family transcriptional regulator [Sphingobium sp.]|tara:strand:+ start:3431 stop:4402 length:972 start_codon:yes stop_codon:yes gene_type:complete